MNTLFSSQAAKFWVAFLAALVIIAIIAWQTAMGDGVVTPFEWGTIVVAVLNAALVYQWPNTPGDTDSDK